MKRIIFLLIFCLLVFGIFGCEQDKIVGENEFYLKNGLYDIGEFSQIKYEPFYDEPCYEFKPSDNYGPLVSFAGKKVNYSLAEGDSLGFPYETSTTLYGLCTLDGKVVVEPVYSYISKMGTTDGFEYFVLQKQRPIKYNQNGKIDYENSFMMVAPPMQIIAADGSWMISAPDGKTSYLSAASEGVIVFVFYNDDGNVFKFYDYDGNFLYEISGYDYIEGYYGGLAKASVYSKYTDNGDMVSDEKLVYLDKKGNVAIDGFVSGTNFSKDGVAAVKTKDGYFAFINTKGEFINDQKYDTLYILGQGNDEMRYYGIGYADKKGEKYIFDSKGNKVKSIECGEYVNIYGDDVETALYSYYQNGNEKWFRLKDNSHFVSEATGNSPYGTISSPDGKDMLFVSKEEGFKTYDPKGKTYVFGLDGKTLSVFENFRYSIDYVDKKYILYKSEIIPEPNEDGSLSQSIERVVLYDIEKGEEIKSFDNASSARFLDKNKRFLLVTNYYTIDARSTEYIYDFEKNEIFMDDIDASHSCEADGKEYISVCTENYITVYDENLNVILRKFGEKNI